MKDNLLEQNSLKNMRLTIQEIDFLYINNYVETICWNFEEQITIFN